MLATRWENYDSKGFQTALSPLETDLLDVLENFSKILLRYVFSVKPYSYSSLLKLKELKNDQVMKILVTYQNWSEWLESSGDPSELPLEDIERNCLKKALDHFGLQADEAFWKTLTYDQIVEFYGNDMVQLYRSLNFFNLTSYSLLDMSIYEWYVLWHRSSLAIEQTMNDLVETMEHYVPVKKFNIPKQTIQEVFNSEMNFEEFVPRVISAEFQFAGSLIAKGSVTSSLPKGFICTSIAEVVTTGPEASELKFI